MRLDLYCCRFKMTITMLCTDLVFNNSSKSFSVFFHSLVCLYEENLNHFEPILMAVLRECLLFSYFSLPEPGGRTITWEEVRE